MQEDSLAIVDTLTQVYSEKWSGAAEGESTGAFIQFMSSNDLIFVVLGVTLIIWAVLLFFLIRLDKKIGKLERQVTQTKEI